MTELQITGKLTKLLPVETGVSKSEKSWTKQNFLVETDDQYNNLYCFNIFGAEKVENLSKYNKEGDTVTVKFNVNCREWEGKYFTDLQAWRVEGVDKDETPVETVNNDLPDIDF